MSTEPVITPMQTTSPWSVVSLISGIASYIALPFLGAIIALVTGYVAKDEIRKSNGTIGGEGMATAGIVLGWINIALILIAIALIVILIIGIIPALGTWSGFSGGMPFWGWH